ncbi:MAG TPA: polyprenol monophosphomannose synthase [Elusimicrobiales bacterium]|nr:polyprenol monophosphomannose synthase [Elusimicrobiales bacterium]
MNEPLLSIILPTYKEAENIAQAIARINVVMGNTPHEIIVADDDSPDLTWQKAQAEAVRFPQVKVLRRTTNRGLYPAVLDGFASATGKYLAVMDADLQHDERLLPRMLEKAQAGAQMVIASRYTRGGGVAGWNAARLLLSRAGNKFAGLLLRRGSTDLMSGFFLIETAAYEKTKPLLRPKGFKILMDLLQNLPQGASVAELSYVFKPRSAGESKLNLKIAWQAAMGLYELSIGRYLPFQILVLLLTAAIFCGIVLLASH